MRTISAKSTRLQKRLLPVYWLGPPVVFLTIWAAFGLWDDASAEAIAGQGTGEVLTISIVVYLGTCLVTFPLMRSRMARQADEVIDAGDYLIVRKDDDETRVALADVTDVSVGRWGITLQLARPGRFGSEITFVPPWKPRPNWLMGPDVTSLIMRVGAAKHRPHGRV